MTETQAKPKRKPNAVSVTKPIRFKPSEIAVFEELRVLSGLPDFSSAVKHAGQVALANLKSKMPKGK